jgi:hypothetical protein
MTKQEIQAMVAGAELALEGRILAKKLERFLGEMNAARIQERVERAAQWYRIPNSERLPRDYTILRTKPTRGEASWMLRRGKWEADVFQGSESVEPETFALDLATGWLDEFNEWLDNYVPGGQDE